MGESAEQSDWAPAGKYRRGLLPAAVAVAATMVWTNGRWARQVEDELANSPDAALTRAARIRRRLRRSLRDRGESLRG